MFNAKQLTEEQVSTIKNWAVEGDQLADIQKKMESELGFRLTYMDTRFLVLDLEIKLKIEVEEIQEEVEKPEKTELTEDDLEVIPPLAQGGSVSVTVDTVARPGVMVSGRVNFPDGESGAWYVDEIGRLGIDPDTAGYRPSEADVATFQKELQAVMERH